jgi:hypothetical protein
MNMFSICVAEASLTVMVIKAVLDMSLIPSSDIVLSITWKPCPVDNPHKGEINSHGILVIQTIAKLKALVWFWIIDET